MSMSRRRLPTWVFPAQRASQPALRAVFRRTFPSDRKLTRLRDETPNYPLRGRAIKCSPHVRILS